MARKERQGEGAESIALDHIARYEFAALQAQGRILDAACGVGYGSKIINAAIGIDICPEALWVARTHYSGPTYIQADLESDWDQGKFDTIVSFETLEHLQNPERVVRRFAESLNPGGRLIASVPNEQFYPFHPEVFVGDVYPHQRHYTPAEFAKLLEPFKVEEAYCQRSKQDWQVMEGTEGKFIIFVCRV